MKTFSPLLLSLLVLVSCTTKQKQTENSQLLVKCSTTNGTFLSITGKDDQYTINGLVDYKANHMGKSKRRTINYTAPRDSLFFYDSNPFSLEDNSLKECSAFGFKFINEYNEGLKKCNSAKSQLEWVGKYRANKAGKKNKKKNAQARKISEDIYKFCSPFAGKYEQVTYRQSNKPNKNCSIEGIELYEMQKPSMKTSQSPIQGVYSTDCYVNQKMLKKLRNRQRL